MALIKTPQDIDAMREGGALLSRALQKAVDAVKPGVTMRELDAIAEQEILAGGGKPSFKGYKAGGKIPFPSTVCISVNDEVVHGLGTRDIVLQDGDIVGLDIGCWYKDLCTDMAVTVPVGKISQERKTLLKITRDAMYAGVDAAIVGKTTHDMAAAIESTVPQKYGIVKSLVGHGVGHAVHESPHVPNFVSKAFPKTLLRAGMCLAIEPMVTRGTDDVYISSDGWTIVTADGTDAAHFEVTIALTESGPEILTPQPEIGL
ncbi:type I methionyl aminopeptidase [bacterium]|nr:type I methionyl aminopeptidase [bacterium]